MEGRGGRRRGVTQRFFLFFSSFWTVVSHGLEFFLFYFKHKYREGESTSLTDPTTTTTSTTSTMTMKAVRKRGWDINLNAENNP